MRRNPEHARREVRAYHDAGLRHVKLYWRLREPEFVAALEEARQLGMGVTGHIDFRVLGFERALQYATGMENIRDVIPFPRAPNQADF